MPNADTLTDIIAAVRPLFPEAPEIALTLGSGLGDFADQLEGARKVPTADLPGYPQSTVPGHKGHLVAGELYGKKLLCFQGRIHLYEGYTVEQITLPVRIAAALGARRLILTNASGGISDRLHPGSLMLITDQIDMQFRRRVFRPGEKESRFSERVKWFTGSPYREDLQDAARKAAAEANIPLDSGALGASLGPTYETPAEVRMMRILGADAACMSTVAEAAEAARLGMDVLGISCITNKACGLAGASLNHEEVIEVAARVKEAFIRLLRAIIQRI